MIDYIKVSKGDVLRLTRGVVPHKGDPFGQKGDLVRVTNVSKHGLIAENKHGELCEFVFDCGAECLEATPWVGAVL